MKLLVHICCANCFLYPFRSLTARGISVRGFWFNPNIHPFSEYTLRLDALRRLENLWNLDIAYEDAYGLREYLRAVVFNEDDRCPVCYRMRLDAAARYAADARFDAFTTTLLVSPYQQFETIERIGRETAEKYAIPFLSEDFRPGWGEGVRVSKELGLYRQRYCGCVYSEMERYGKKTVDRRR